MNDPRGSNWRKWDLHAHTPVDMDWIGRPDLSTEGHKKAFAKQYIDLAEEQGLSVIAITNHNFCNRYEDVLIPFIQEEARERNITILPGFEITASDGSGVHLLVIFPETSNLNQIFDLVNHLFVPGQPRIPTSSNSHNIPYSNKSLIQIRDKIKEANLEAIFIFAHADRGNGVLDGRTITGTRRVEEWQRKFINICQISKNPSEFEEDTFLYRVINSEERYYQREMAYIVASDCRTIQKPQHGDTIEEGRHYLGEKFTWIKADPTFEGLRQILYEPFERVKIQEERPDQKNDYQIIDSIEIKHEDFFEQTIPLNQNLNAIIGGRSSGKSLLLGSLAKKIGTDRDVKSNLEYENYIDNQLVPSITLKWKDEVEDVPHSVEYFPQSYINGLAAKSDDVNKLLERIIKNDITKKGGIDSYNNFCIENKSNINQKIGDFFALRQKALDKKLEILEQGSKEGVKKQIAKWKEELGIIKGGMESEITIPEDVKYKELQDEISAKQKQIGDSKKTLLQLADLRVLKIFNPIENELISIDDSLRSQISQAYETLREAFKTQWTGKIEHFSGGEQEKIDINDARIKVIEADELFIKCKANFSRNAAYLHLEKKLKLEEEKLVIIIGLEKELTEINEKKAAEIISTLLLNREYYLRAKALTEILSFSKNDVEITAVPYFRDSDFKNSMSMRFDQRVHRDLIDYQYDNNDTFATFIQRLFEKLVNNEIQFKGSYGLQQVLIDLIAGNFYEIRYDVKYDGDNLSAMSEGKKAFIILRILLDFNEKQCPILIDQPEDDLDNRAIYDELVDYIKTKKRKRQIILVTHNPNIVVGADAEEVIVANQHGIRTDNQNDAKFEYLSGSLENVKEKDATLPILIGQGIKQHVCDILEGGIAAFSKRENKYNLKS